MAKKKTKTRQRAIFGPPFGNNDFANSCEERRHCLPEPRTHFNALYFTNKNKASIIQLFLSKDMHIKLWLIIEAYSPYFIYVSVVQAASQEKFLYIVDALNWITLIPLDINI